MKSLPIIDLIIVIAYLVGMVAVGVYFSRKNTNAEQFTKASGRIPGWAIGISIYATFLSSNTFPRRAGQGIRKQLEFFCIQLVDAVCGMGSNKVFHTFLQRHGRSFGLYAP
jgi:SSS family solute:Na+ symporter